MCATLPLELRGFIPKRSAPDASFQQQHLLEAHQEQQLHIRFQKLWLDQLKRALQPHAGAMQVKELVGAMVLGAHMTFRRQIKFVNIGADPKKQNDN